jgi:hypothetical protein
MFCPSDRPIQCVTGICVSSPSKCLPTEIANGYTTKSLRILTGGKNMRILNSAVSINGSDIGCAADMPYRCFDGSCRTRVSNCPTYQGCSDPMLPYRCNSGICALDQQTCLTLDANVGKCANGTIRCEDSICRANCPAFHGCPLSAPLQCPNGNCGMNLGDCAGESDCPMN